MKLLFLDDHHVQSNEGARRIFHKLSKYADGPVCELTGPGGGPINGLMGGYERDPISGEFVLWYGSVTPGLCRGDADFRFLCMARSTDGLHWEKPSLGIFQYEGSQNNNIILAGHRFLGRSDVGHDIDTICVNRDPLESDPAAQLKLSAYRIHRGTDPADNKSLKNSLSVELPTGLYLSQSADGIHWPLHERPVFLSGNGWGDTNTWMADTLRGGYRIFTKRVPPLPDGTPMRLRFQSTSHDWINWTTPQQILPLLPHDQSGDQTYWNHAFVYGDLYVGFTQMFHRTVDLGQSMHLSFSRDGDVWHRPVDAAHILPRGQATAWDSRMVKMFPSPPIRVGNELWFYYTASPQPHDPPFREIPPKDKRPSGPALAKLRVDGFASMSADADAPILLRSFELRHASLLANVDVTKGSMQVALLDLVGRPYPGFALEDCDPLTGDLIDHPITWRGQSCESLMFKPVQLDIRLNNASLYAITGGRPLHRET